MSTKFSLAILIVSLAVCCIVFSRKREQPTPLAIVRADSIVDLQLYDHLCKSLYPVQRTLDKQTIKGLMLIEATERNITFDSLRRLVVQPTGDNLRVFMEAHNLIRGVPDPQFPGVLHRVTSPRGHALLIAEYEQRELEAFALTIVRKHNLDVIAIQPPTPGARAIQ